MEDFKSRLGRHGSAGSGSRPVSDKGAPSILGRDLKKSAPMAPKTMGESAPAKPGKYGI